MNNTVSSNPWPGLGSYDETGQYKFCGRGRATNELYSLISNNAVISLFGRSGIGKTSLLKAGVTPLLARKGYRPVYVRLSQEEKVCDNNGCKLSYAECIIKCVEKRMEDNGFIKSEVPFEVVTSEDSDSLWSYFCKTAFLSSAGEQCTPVIILDQFEEIFQDRREDAAMLMRQLYALVNGSRRLPAGLDYDDFRSRSRFVMSFRDDSLYRLEDVINEYNLASFKENRYLLKALSRDDALDVVTEPGEGLVEDEVAKQILDKVVAMGEGGSVDPAILSLLMYGLYERMIQKGESSIQGNLVAEAGNDIVRDFYERGMSGIELPARKYLEEHLVSSDGRRRSVAAADARTNVKDEELKSLADKHILTKLERGRFTDYELTHDVLCPIVAASRSETLAKEKIVRNRRVTRILTAIVAVVLAIVAVFFFQNKHLKEQRWTALGNQSRFIAEKAVQLAEEGNGYLAKLLLINTIPSNLDKPERPLTSESVAAMGRIYDNNTGILRGHDTYISSAAYSNDGTKIVSASWDETIRIWDASTGKCINTLQGHTFRVQFAIYSPNDRHIVSASNDMTVRIWDASKGECLEIMKGHTHSVLSAMYSPDGKLIVSSSADSTMRIWNAVTGGCVKILEEDSGVNFASFSPDGNSIVSASNNGDVKIWDVSTGECKKVLKGHASYVRSAMFSPDGTKIVSASWDAISIWDVSTGECKKVLKGYASHFININSAMFSPDGTKIVSASSDETIRIWDVATWQCLNSLQGHSDEVNFAMYSPNGESIVSASNDGTVRIWDANVTTHEYYKDLIKNHDVLLYRSIMFSPDSNTILCSSSDSTIHIWDIAKGKILKILKGHADWVECATYSPDGRYIVSASRDKTIREWDALTGECIKIFKGHTGAVCSVVYNHDGKTIISASVDNTVRIWDIATGKSIKVIPIDVGPVVSMSYSSRGRSIVVYVESTVNNENGDANNLMIYDINTGECLKILEGHRDYITSVIYSPDGNTIMSASNDKSIKIWDASTGKCLKTMGGHMLGVNSAAYSPDGTKIVSTSRDGTIRIWDVATGGCMKVIDSNSDSPELVSFSPNGKSIVMTDFWGSIKIWTAPPSFPEMLEATRERFKNRQLTPEERHRYYLD